MIDFYFSPTPNGLKVRLFLKEVELHEAELAKAELEYRIVPVSLSRGEQHSPEFLKISPNGKIPAIVDHAPGDGSGPLAVFESGAILVYLAQKCGRFMPTDLRGRVDVLQWVFWQGGGLGPMAGQIGHFNVFAPEKVPYAIDRYTRELHRLYGVLDRRLAGSEYIAGEYSIADIACYPWIVPHAPHGQRLEDFPDLKRWFETVRERPATRAIYVGVIDVYSPSNRPMSDEERRILFGQTAQDTARKTDA